MNHAIVVTGSNCPSCVCGYDPTSPTGNMEGLWRSAIAHVDDAVIADTPTEVWAAIEVLTNRGIDGAAFEKLLGAASESAND